LALLLPISKRRQEDSVVFDKQGGKVTRLSPKTVHTIFLSGICCLLNDFQNPVKKPAIC